MKFTVLLRRRESAWLTIYASTQAEADATAIKWANDDEHPLLPYSLNEWEIDHSFRCLDCGVDTYNNGEYPLMLNDDLWHQIVPGGEGMLCQSCMEKRLGRPLTPNDLHPLAQRNSL